RAAAAPTAFPYATLFRSGKARFEGRAAFRTWLFAVIRRTAAANRRTRWLRRWRFIPQNGDGGSVEHDLIRNERAASLLRALPRRSEEHTSELQSLRHLVC